ncbi:hypothetical protein E2C01_063873 [Portunus trituberculatus]|uniref:Uncharacterized protein n=1 Tax=Portunus trituberculatus TaxID=210409 RepID=A0A5B7HHL1_PORTR|nr:hypothetical protein [Portunus trituberculatus]
MSTITVGGVEGMLPIFVADMEEPCLMGLDFLVQSAACVDLGRMQTQIRGETVPLILEDAAEQVEIPVTSSDVEDERLELHYRVVREGEVADATVTARGRQAAVSSCGGEVDGDAGEVSSALPPHVVDLAVRSSTKLTPEQVMKFQKLLMEHDDVFSRDTKDLGCTSLVQHSINTADSEVGSDSEVVGDSGIDIVTECAVGVREDPMNEAASEPRVSRPVKTRKRPQ